MIDEKNRSREIDPELFLNPTWEYRAVPFWSWNCKVTKEMIDRQLPVFKKMGFGGVDIHPRTGLDTAYLSEEFMELVQYTVQKCREIGLVCWLYDDDRFPSGCAGGIVTKSDRYRGRFLLLTETRRSREEGYYEDKKAFEQASEMGMEPAGYYATAYALTFTDKALASYRRLETEEDIAQALASGEKVRYAYVKLMEKEAWFEDQSYVDTMNPEAIAEFIRITHEAYYEKLGEDFGGTVPAIFTDEPRLGKHSQISGAMSLEDVTMPFTEYFAQTMEEKCGIDPLDVAPEYVWNLQGGRFSVNRYHYRNLTAECFVTAFMDQIAKWCGEHQIAMTGHVLAEDTLGSQVYALGDCMRCYRSMDLPGIDVLVDRREYAAVKQASSVARQNGRKGVVSELYGVTHWDCDFKTFKLQGDWQAALGITVRVPHLSHMSLGGEAKRDWPGSIFFHAPWYEEYPYIEEYFARLNTVLTRGKAEVNIGVLHPVESMWMVMGPDDQTAEIRREMDEDFGNLIKWLLFGTLDFDFLSEALLPEQCREFFSAPSKKLAVGEMEYSVILVPCMITIRSTTLDILEAFKRQGGSIVFMGRIPELEDAKESDRARRLAADCICIRKSRTELHAALESFRSVEVRDKDGLRSDGLFYQLRRDYTCKWLFLCHVNHREHHASDVEQYRIRVKGRYQVTQYDARTGECGAVEPEVEWQKDGAYTVISCAIYAEDSVLYQLRDEGTDTIFGEMTAEKSRVASEAESFETVECLTEISAWRRQEKNACLLDYAQFRVDGGELKEREEILRIDNRIRASLGFAIKEERMNQPYHLQEREHHKVTLYYHVRSEITTPALLAVEGPDTCRIWLNGREADRKAVEFYVDPSISVIILPNVTEGDNELVVEMDYHQKSNLENMYLLGDFDVALEGTSPVIRERRGTLYIGDITRQGMAFYTGNLEYEFQFAAEEEKVEYYVRVPHFKAPLLAVSVDGEKKGLIAYAPHRVKLGKLKKGIHRLTICLYGSRFNGFGTLHNANDEFVWYGPNSFRTTGDDWTDSYRVKPVGIMSAVELEKRK